MPARERKPCIAKVGEPDISNGMATCGAEAEWLNAGDIRQDGSIAQCTGWRHADPAHDADHGAVPKGWV